MNSAFTVRSFLPACLMCMIGINGAALAHGDDEPFQALHFALTQQKQSFEYDEVNPSLNVQGYRVSYQVGSGPWRFGVDYNQAQDDKAASRPNGGREYYLASDYSGVNIFSEYSWSQDWNSYWLAVGYGISQSEHHYRYFNLNKKVEEEKDSQVDYQSATLDSGYLYGTQSGQWVVSGNLTRQFTEDKNHYLNTDSVPVGGKTNESGWLAGLGIHYGHYVSITQDWELYLNAGLYRQLVLAGEARTHSPRRDQLSIAQQDQSESQELSQTASTSQQVQISLLHKQGSIGFNVDKLDGQAMSEAYYSLGVTVNF